MKKLAIVLLSLSICLALSGCDSGHKTASCGICGREFKSGDSGGNYMNIAWSGFCKSCEKGYHMLND